jgi:hypothetical protein
VADTGTKGFEIRGDRLILALDVLDFWATDLDGIDESASWLLLFSRHKVNDVFRARMNLQNQKQETNCQNRFREIYEKELFLVHELLEDSEDGIQSAIFDAQSLVTKVMRSLPVEEQYVAPYYGFVNILKAIASGEFTEADFKE